MFREFLMVPFNNPLVIILVLSTLCVLSHRLTRAESEQTLPSASTRRKRAEFEPALPPASFLERLRSASERIALFSFNVPSALVPANGKIKVIKANITSVQVLSLFLVFIHYCVNVC